MHRASGGKIQTAREQSGEEADGAGRATTPECDWLRTALHDMAQPLMALECGLFLSTLDPEQDAAKLRQAIEEATGQCQRMLVCFRAMQSQLSQGRPAGTSETV